MKDNKLCSVQYYRPKHLPGWKKEEVCSKKLEDKEKDVAKKLVNASQGTMLNLLGERFKKDYSIEDMWKGFVDHPNTSCDQNNDGKRVHFEAKKYKSKSSY